MTDDEIDRLIDVAAFTTYYRREPGFLQVGDHATFTRVVIPRRGAPTSEWYREIVTGTIVLITPTKYERVPIRRSGSELVIPTFRELEPERIWVLPQEHLRRPLKDEWAVKALLHFWALMMKGRFGCCGEEVGHD